MPEIMLAHPPKTSESHFTAIKKTDKTEIIKTKIKLMINPLWTLK